jgi:hypothetical protein
MHVIFACLLTLQFLVIVLHDWLDIPGWTHGSQVQSVVGRRKLLIATLINAIFPATAVAFAWSVWRRPAPAFVSIYSILYCAITVLSAVFMWYVPYVLGAAEKTCREYACMYAGTRHVLPARKDNPRPNLLHLYFHALFVVNLCLAVLDIHRT